MIVYEISMKMKTSVILLSFLLHLTVVSTKYLSSAARDPILKQRYLETWLKGVNNPDYDGASAKHTLDDGQERSRVTQRGLNQRETRSVQEASSGTDWGGSVLRGTARQEQLEKKRNIPPLISMLSPRLKVAESIGRKSKLPLRNRRSSQDSTYSANVIRIEGLTDEADIHKILANAKAKLSIVKSDNMGTFRDNAFGDDWLMFVLPFNNGIYTESLLRMGNGGKTKTRTKEQGDDSVGEISTVKSKIFDSARYNDIVDNSERTDILKKYDSSLSRWNAGSGTEYLNELNMETALTERNYEMSNKEENKVEKSESLKNSGTNRYSSKNERRIENYDNDNGHQDYGYVKANRGGKNKEILFGEISIDNTTRNVTGSDKPSTAELPVKIPEPGDEAGKNKRPSNDESRFIVDPFVLLASLEGDTRQGKDSKSLFGYETGENLQDRKLISGEINTASYRGEEFRNSGSDSNKNTDIRDKKPSQYYRGTLYDKKLKKIDGNTREEGNSDESSLHKMNANIWEWIENVESNVYRIDESTGIDASEYLERKYYKQKSAAETSDRADSNERVSVKHRGRVEGKSAYVQDVQNERGNVEKNVNRESRRMEAKGKHDNLAEDRHDYPMDSQGNVNREWKMVEDNLQKRTVKPDENTMKRILLMEDSRSEAVQDKHEEKNLIDNKDSGKEKVAAEYLEKKVFGEEDLKKIKFAEKDSDEEVVRVGRLNGHKVRIGNIVGEKLEAENRDVVELNVKNVEDRKFELEKDDVEKFKGQIVGRKEADSGNLERMKFGEGNRKVSREFGVDSAEDWKFKLASARVNKFESNNAKRDKIEKKYTEDGRSVAGVFREKIIETKNVEGGESVSKTVERRKFGSKELEGNVTTQRMENAKFKADNLEGGQVGLKDSGQKRYDMRNPDGRKFGLTNLKKETSGLRNIQDLKSRARDQSLSSSGRVIVGNNKSQKFDQFNVYSLYEYNNKNTELKEASFLKDKKETRENHIYTKEDRDEREKYKKYKDEKFIDKTDNIKSGKKLVTHSFNSGSTYTKKDLHITDNNAIETLNERSKSLKEGSKNVSYEGSLNEVKEYSISEGKDREDQKLISLGKLMNKGLRVDRPHKDNYNLKVDNVAISAIKDEAGKRKGIGALSGKEKLHKRIETIEKGDEKLLLNTKQLETKRSDSKEVDSERKYVKSKRILEENKSLTDKNSKLTNKYGFEYNYLSSKIKYVTEAETAGRTKVLKESKSTKQSKSHSKHPEEYNLNKLSEKKSVSGKTLAMKSEQNRRKNETTLQPVNPLKETSEAVRQNENSQELLPDDLHVNRAKKLSGVTSARTGRLLGVERSDESSATSTEARVAGLGDENKAFGSREDDISEVQSATSTRGNSGTSATANRVDDRKKVKISRSGAYFEELSDTDTRQSEYTNRVIENENTFVGARESYKDDDKTDSTRLTAREKLSNVDTRGKYGEKEDLDEDRKVDSMSNYARRVAKSKTNLRDTERNEGISRMGEWTRTSAEKKKKSKTQAANEVYNALETLDAEGIQTIVTLVESERGEPKEVLSKKGTKDTKPLMHNLIDEDNSKESYVDHSRSIVNVTQETRSNSIESKQKYLGNIEKLFDKSDENSRGKLFAKVKENDGIEQKLRINHLTESLTENKGPGLINQQGDKIVANDVNSEQASDSSFALDSKFSGNSDTSWGRNKSSVAINQVPEEESAAEKTTESNVVVEDHSSKQHGFKMISNLSLESGRRNKMGLVEKDETIATDEQRYTTQVKNNNFESCNSNVVKSSESLTKKLSKDFNDNYKAGESDKFKERDGIRRIDKSDFAKDSSIGTSNKIIEKSIQRDKYQVSTQQKSGSDDVRIGVHEQEASTNVSESIERLLNKEEGFQSGSNTGIEVTESINDGGQRDESSSAQLALKPSKDEASFDSSAESSRKNDKQWMKKVNEHDRLAHEGAESIENEIMKSNMEKGGANGTPSATWQLIEDNGLEALSAAGIRTALNTKTTNEARPSGMDENPIIRRLTEGSVAHEINWTDNERYKELSAEAACRTTREKTLANVDANGFRKAPLSKVKFVAESGSIKMQAERFESKIRDTKDVEEQKSTGESDQLELRGDNVKSGQSENRFEKYNDTAVESGKERVGIMMQDDFTRNTLNTSHVAVSLHESHYETGNESDKLANVNVARQTELADFSSKNDALGERKNKGTKGGDMVNGEEKNSGENGKSKTIRIVHVEEDRNLLNKSVSCKNRGKYKEKINAVASKYVKVKKQGYNNLFIESTESDMGKSDFGRKSGEVGTKIRNTLEKQLDKKALGKKSNREFESSTDGGSYDSVKYRTSESTDNFHEISDDKVETQIQKPLTGTELTITRHPWLKQHQDGNILRETGKLGIKVEEKYTSNENQSRGTATNINIEREIVTRNKLVGKSKQLSSTLNIASSNDRDVSLERQKSNAVQEKQGFIVDSRLINQKKYKHRLLNSDTLNSVKSDSLKEHFEKDTILSGSKKHAERQKSTEKIVETKKEHQSVHSTKDRGRNWSLAPSTKYSEANTNEINVLSNSLRRPSSDYTYSLDKNEKSTVSTSPLSNIPPPISFSEEIANAKFVKKLQPSLWKFAQTPSEVAEKREAYVGRTSKPFKMQPDEKEVGRPVKSSTCTSLSEVLGTRAMNDDLCTILGSIFLFTRCREDTMDGGVPSTYGVSTDGRASKVVSEKGKRDEEALESDSIHELPRMPQEPGDDTVDVYIVKRTSEGRVKIVHMENVVPLF